VTTSKKKSKPTTKKQSSGGKKVADKKSTDAKPAGKQPREQKNEVFEPGAEG
jgi:hypothetical protein